jgi:hypothetical protein
MSKTLAKVGANAAVVSIDIDNLNVDAALGAMDRAMAKTGMSGGGGSQKKLFPGQSYFMKKGTWYFGQGKKAADIDEPRLVVNVPHLGMAYLKFEENQNGKVFPKYSDVAIIAAGQDLVDREALGDLDEDEWQEDDNGRKQDPWSLQVVIPCREEGGTEYNHVLATRKSNQNAMAALFREVMSELKLKPGRLPIIQFGTTELSRKVPPKNGKGKTTTQTWDAMKYEVVGWVKAEPHDRLNQNVDMGDDSGEVDTGDVTATARVEHKPATKPAPAKAAKPALKKKVVEEL